MEHIVSVHDLFQVTRASETSFATLEWVRLKWVRLIGSAGNPVLANKAGTARHST